MIRKFMGKMLFRQKLLYFQILVMVMISIMMGMAMSIFLGDTVQKNEEAHLERLLQVVNDNISRRIDVFESVSFDLLVSDSLKENLNQTDSITYGRAFNTVLDLLGTKTIGTIGLKNIVIIDSVGHVYSSNLTLLLPKDFQLETTEVFQVAEQEPGELVWLAENDIYEMYSMSVGHYKNTSDIHAAAVIRNYVPEKIYGVVIFTLETDFFRNMTFSDEKLQGTNLYLVSSDKSKIYKISGTEEELQEELLKSLDFENEVSSFQWENSKIVSQRYNATMGWFLVSVTDMHMMKNWFYQMVPVLILILGIGIIVFSINSNRFFKSMTKGIDKLTVAMAEVEKGNFDVTVERCQADEIGKLSDDFNHMIKQINELIIQQYQQELLTQSAEFKMLQAQINPHFLYNVLDMLNWQLVLKGEYQLSDSVIAIGSLLRYSMEQNCPNVFLKEEIDNVKDYLSVQYSISGKEISYKIDICDEEEIWLPRLSLQPFIENTIIHGFKGRDKNNYLEIAGAFRDEEHYVLKICDNGIGIHEDVLQKLANVSEAESSEHVGIVNVKKRILYLYMGKAKIDFTSQYGYGTTIEIVLPVKSVRWKENGNETCDCG